MILQKIASDFGYKKLLTNHFSNSPIQNLGIQNSESFVTVQRQKKGLFLMLSLLIAEVLITDN